MRLIDADALLEELRKGTIVTDDLYGMGIMAGNDHAINKINVAPTIEAEPVRQGRWINLAADELFLFACSECGRGSDVQRQRCPGCFAKMDKEAEA